MPKTGNSNPELGFAELKRNAHHLDHHDDPTTVKVLSQYAPAEEKRMLRNVWVISLSFALLFTASVMGNLQSSLHPVDGLGNWASSVAYSSVILSNLFVPTALIRQLSVKRTLILSMAGNAIYVAAQFHPRFYTLLPAAVIVGLSAAPLWAAKCTYLSHLGQEYGRLTSKNVEEVMGRFFGIFFMTFQTHAIFGNIISSTVLSSELRRSSQNDTGDSDDPDPYPYDQCGSNFCPGTNLTSSDDEGGIPPEKEQNVFILALTFLLIAILAAVVMAIFVDPLTRYGERRREGSTRKLLVATFKQMKKPYQILLVPLTMWSGLEQGFLNADFTAAFVTCGWGIENVGYVLIGYGLADSVGSLCYSWVVRKCGRNFSFIFGTLLNLGLIAWMLEWVPNSNEKEYFFIIACLWGLADACWQCGINSYYGLLFPNDEEAAFSCYRLWESVGFVVAFAQSNFNCVHIKLYVLMAVLALGMAGYGVIQICERKRNSKVNE